MVEVSTFQLIKMGDLNHHSTLFVAKALEWLSETGFITACHAYEDPNELVYRGMDDFKFLKPADKGEILRFTGKIINVGTTSLTVSVKACSFADKDNSDPYCMGKITYVVIDKETRKKKAHNIPKEIMCEHK